jgi:hypothetical protein
MAPQMFFAKPDSNDISWLYLPEKSLRRTALFIQAALAKRTTKEAQGKPVWWNFWANKRSKQCWHNLNFCKGI